MARIILTADRTLMSEYNGNIFLGFAACGPRFIPDWLYKKIFCPPVERENGQARYGHCGQRKIEAALINHGFSPDDIKVVPPERLSKEVDKDTKVLCITTHDPLGLGPASTTFSDLSGRETFTTSFFRKLVNDPVIRKHNLTVLVGGSGAWQVTDERIMANLGIDGVVVGEGEITAVKLIEQVLNGDEFPAITQGEVVPLEQIPLIKKPTLNGIVEICRGCGRGCRFCNPTMLNFRCQPVERIIEEVRINTAADRGVIFHAEDVLRYKATSFVPDEKKVVELFEAGKKETDMIGISHFAHASAASNPKLIEQLSEIMEAGSKQYPYLSGQVGIETGSPRIVAKYMKGKAKPYKPSEWPEMIIESHKLLHDNHWVPAETLIVGLPGEKPEDTRKTIEMIHGLSEYKSLIVPLYFIPIGNLQGSGFFKTKDNTPEYWELIATCINHDFNWVYELADESMSAVGVSGWKIWSLKRVIKYMDRKLKPYLDVMMEGINPLDLEE